MSSIEDTIRRIVREEVRAALADVLGNERVTGRVSSVEPLCALSERERAPWMIRPLTYDDWWLTLPFDDRPPFKVERLLGTAEAAEMLGVTRGTLYDWRAAVTGPPAVKYGRLVKYRIADLEQWIASRNEVKEQREGSRKRQPRKPPLPHEALSYSQPPASPRT